MAGLITNRSFGLTAFVAVVLLYTFLISSCKKDTGASPAQGHALVYDQQVWYPTIEHIWIAPYPSADSIWWMTNINLYVDGQSSGSLSCSTGSQSQDCALASASASSCSMCNIALPTGSHTLLAQWAYSKSEFNGIMNNNSGVYTRYTTSFQIDSGQCIFISLPAIQ